MGNLAAALGVGASVLAADWAGREFARSHVKLYKDGDATADAVRVGVLPVWVVHSRNPHIGRGLLPGSIEKQVNLVGAPVAVAALAWAGSKLDRGGAMGAGLVGAGLIGSSVEFATRGYVTDYIGIPGLPMTPNIGDIALLAGGGVMLASVLRLRR